MEMEKLRFEEEAPKFRFDVEQQPPAKIKVVGIGGAEGSLRTSSSMAFFMICFFLGDFFARCCFLDKRNSSSGMRAGFRIYFLRTVMAVSSGSVIA